MHYFNPEYAKLPRYRGLFLVAQRAGPVHHGFRRFSYNFRGRGYFAGKSAFCTNGWESATCSIASFVEAANLSRHATHSGCSWESLFECAVLGRIKAPMVTDAPPRKKNRLFFAESDRLNTLGLPHDDRLCRIASAIEAAMKTERAKVLVRVAGEFLDTAADFYQVKHCNVRVLAARPLRVRERSTIELFGDYNSNAILIRVWMKTAIRKKVTSFGTFLSTLCHEFCHHLDFQRFQNSWHTRGFYERTALLYHHARGTPQKRLIWLPVPGHRWRIDWQRTNRMLHPHSSD